MPHAVFRKITDSGVFRLLTQPDEAPLPVTPARTKKCARCGEELSLTACTCPRCHLYTRVSAHTWRVALEDAIRYLRQGRRTR